MKNVQSTPYAGNFPKEAIEEISLLDTAEAAVIFESAFGPGVRSFFDFPDDHWLVKSEKQKIGRWLEAYNTGDVKFVEAMLKQTVDWKLEERIYFLVKRSIVFQTCWMAFMAHWDAFLASEDDSPILMRVPEKWDAIIFTSLGDVLLVQDDGNHSNSN